MKIRLLYSFLLFLPFYNSVGQSKHSIEQILNSIPFNSPFQNIIAYLNSSNCFYVNNLDSTLSDNNLFGQSYYLKKMCMPEDVDSVSLLVYKGIRGKRIRKTKYSRPINITDLEMKFFTHSSQLTNTIYLRMWDSLKNSKTNIALLEVGVDSSSATYIEEQKFNRKGLKNSALSLIKSGTQPNYIRFRYRRDD